jgi:hypothetical protein
MKIKAITGCSATLDSYTNLCGFPVDNCIASALVSYSKDINPFVAKGRFMGGPEDLLQEIKSIQSSKKIGATCSVSKFMETMSQEEVSAVTTAFLDQSIDSMTIEVWLNRRGYPLRRHTISRHRRGECACPK